MFFRRPYAFGNPAAMGGGSLLPVPQNLRLAAIQNPETITVEWDSIPSSPDFEVEVYTPDDVWVSLGGTMGGTSREYGVSDGMVYGATYSFRVRSTLDFVTFSDWSAVLSGVVAPLTIYYLNQGSGQWTDPANWFQDQYGTIPHWNTPIASNNCVINAGYTVNEVPSSGYKSVTNYGTVFENFGTVILNASIGTITTNNGTVTTNSGTVTDNNFGTVITNIGSVTSNNYGTISTNLGTVIGNQSVATVTTNSGTVTTNSGTITTNSGLCANNFGSITTNSGTVDTNQTSGTIISNTPDGTVGANYGNVTSNCGTVVNDYGYVGPC